MIKGKSLCSNHLIVIRIAHPHPPPLHHHHRCHHHFPHPLKPVGMEMWWNQPWQPVVVWHNHTSVHLTQLITKSIKASINALKLSDDDLENHTTRGRRSRGGWSGKGWRSRRLGPWPLWLKLGLTLSNGHTANDNHDGKVSMIGHKLNDPLW